MSIYIHIPFCKSKCIYCDFYSETTELNKSDYLQALALELDLQQNYLTERKLNSIYFGGGTPSLLSAKEIEQILTMIKKYYNYNEKTEITIEANPDDINEKYLQEISKIGINRLSIGVQSFFDEDLYFLKRRHNAKQSINSIEIAKKYFENISIDLIYGQKLLTIDKWHKNIEKFLMLEIPHLSAYSLTIEEKTELYQLSKNNNNILIDDENFRKQFLFLVEKLFANNFRHYEISSFAKKNFQSKHNSTYWQGTEYLGLGASAHSYNKITRQWNAANLKKYTKSILKNKKIPFETEQLSMKDKLNDYIITHLRTAEGMKKNYIKTHFPNQYTSFLQKINSQKKLLSIHNDKICLNNNGKLLINKVLEKMIWI